MDQKSEFFPLNQLFFVFWIFTFTSIALLITWTLLFLRNYKSIQRPGINLRELKKI